MLTPVAAAVLPEVWEDDSVPVKQRTFPSDHCGVLIDLQWSEIASGTQRALAPEGKVSDAGVPGIPAVEPQLKGRVL